MSDISHRADGVKLPDKLSALIRLGVECMASLDRDVYEAWSRHYYVRAPEGGKTLVNLAGAIIAARMSPPAERREIVAASVSGDSDDLASKLKSVAVAADGRVLEALSYIWPREDLDEDMSDEDFAHYLDANIPPFAMAVCHKWELDEPMADKTYERWAEWDRFAPVMLRMAADLEGEGL